MKASLTQSLRIGALALFGSASFAAAQPLQWEGYNVFTNEEVEINVGFDPNTSTTFTSLVVDENTNNDFPADESLLWIRENHVDTLQSDPPPAYSALGSEGDKFYLLPGSNPFPDEIYHGFAAYSVNSGQLESPFALELTDFAGPGNVLIWSNFDEPPIIDSTRSPGSYGSISMEPDAHLHRNWGFSERGIYRLTFAVSANLFGTSDPAPSVPSDYLYLIDPFPHHWWQVRHFGSNAVEPAAALDAPTAAPGIPNLLAYAFDLDPANPSPADLPQMVLEQVGPDQHAALQVRMPGGEPERDDRSDLIYQVEATSDLSGKWDVLVAGEDYTWQVAGLDHDDTPLMRAVLADTVDSTPARFLRLRLILVTD